MVSKRLGIRVRTRGAPRCRSGCGCRTVGWGGRRSSLTPFSRWRSLPDWTGRARCGPLARRSAAHSARFTRPHFDAVCARARGEKPRRRVKAPSAVSRVANSEEGSVGVGGGERFACGDGLGLRTNPVGRVELARSVGGTSGLGHVRDSHYPSSRPRSERSDRLFSARRTKASRSMRSAECTLDGSDGLMPAPDRTRCRAHLC